MQEEHFFAYELLGNVVIIPCKLKRETCDTLNLNSGRIYSGIVSRHWRLLRQKDCGCRSASETLEGRVMKVEKQLFGVTASQK